MTSYNFIEYYPSAFPSDFCDYLIEVGEKNIIKAEKRPKGKEEDFQDLSFSLSPLLPEEATQFFLNTLQEKCITPYEEKYSVALKGIMNKGYELHDLKFQKTTPTQGFHLWHSEFAPIEKYWERWGVYTLYLNDVIEGGETEFLYQSQRVKPKKGAVSIFPSYYTHTHRGNPPISNIKYILTGWLNFVQEAKSQEVYKYE